MWGKATFGFLQQDFFWRQAILFSIVLFFADSFMVLSNYRTHLYSIPNFGLLLDTFVACGIKAGILYVCLHGFMAKAPTKKSLMQVWAVAVGFGIVFLITQQILNLCITLVFSPAYFMQIFWRLFYFKHLFLFLIPFVLIAFPLAYHFQNETVYVSQEDKRNNGRMVVVGFIVLIVFYLNRNSPYIDLYLPHIFCLLFMLYIALFFKPSK